MFTLKGYAVQCSLHPMNEYIFVLRSRQICLRTNSYADPNQHYNKSKQPHAPLRSHKFGSTSVDLFPKSAVLLLLVLAKRDSKWVF